MVNGEDSMEASVGRMAAGDLPWFLVFGADGADDGDGAGGDGDQDDVEGDGESGEGDEWVPPSREEWDELVGGQRKLIAALRKASAQARRRKEKLRERNDEDNDQTDGDDTDDEPIGTTAPAARDSDIARAAARAAQQVEDRYKPMVVRSAVTEALRGAGWNGKNDELVLRMLNVGEIDVDFDDDGSPVVTGIDAQIAEIKEEFPAWFRKRRAAVSANDGDDKPKPKRPAGDWRTQISSSFN